MSPPRIQVNVLFFAYAHELAGTSQAVLELDGPATVRDLERELRARFPRLGEHLGRYRIAVGQELAGPETPLASGAEVAVLPPVSGG